MLLDQARRAIRRRHPSLKRGWRECLELREHAESDRMDPSTCAVSFHFWISCTPPVPTTALSIRSGSLKVLVTPTFGYFGVM